jgi:hypothetical protein
MEKVDGVGRDRSLGFALRRLQSHPLSYNGSVYIGVLDFALRRIQSHPLSYKASVYIGVSRPYTRTSTVTSVILQRQRVMINAINDR